MEKDSAKRVGRAFAEIVARVSFVLWEKPEFRKLIQFETLPRPEQDRIFNEIEVSFLGLYHLYLENLTAQIGEEKESEMIKELKAQLIDGFLGMYQELEIDDKLIDMWQQLIDLRFKEYEEDYELLMTQTKNDQEFEKMEISKATWARVQTITLDCLTHIRKGKIVDDDPLKKYLQDWVINIDKLSSDAMKDLVFDPKGVS